MTKSTSPHIQWHSFWFGFMISLSVFLVIVLFLVITKHLSFTSPTAPQNISKDTPVKNETEKTTPRSLNDIMATLNIDADKIKQCVDEKTFAQKVQDDIDSGIAADVQGTPHAFIMTDEALYEIPGAYEEKGMRTFFDDLIADRKPKAINIKATHDLAPISEKDRIKGVDFAKITVVIYSDMDCPYCKKFHKSITNIMPDYTDSIRWVFRHMPIDRSHPEARAKAETAECIAATTNNDHFWTFIEAVFAQ